MADTKPIVFLDTETTGLGPDRQIWEVAAIRYETVDDVLDGEPPSHELHHFLTVDVTTADAYSLKVGDFYGRHPDGLAITDPEPAQPEGAHGYLRWPLPPHGRRTTDGTAAKTIARITHGATIAGINPSFDTEKLAELLHDNGYAPTWDYHLLDVRNLAIGYLSHIRHMLGTDAAELLDLKTDELAQCCRVTATDRHTAMGDAAFTRDWYTAITARPDCTGAGFPPADAWHAADEIRKALNGDDDDRP